MKTLFLLLSLVIAALAQSGVVGVDSAKENRNDAVVAPVVASAPNAKVSVRETDSTTNSAANAVKSDSATPGEAPVESAPKAKRGIAGSEDADPSEAGTLSNALKNAVDDQNSQKGNTANPEAADDGGLGEEQDHEVEPQEEGGEEGDEHADEDEEHGADGGGVGGDEIEEEGSEEAERRSNAKPFSESDEEEYDDDPLPRDQGVNAKDIDVEGRSKVTPEELAAAKEDGGHFDGEGNIDVKDMNKHGDVVDELNKDLISKVERKPTEAEAEQAAVDEAAAKVNPDQVNSKANGEDFVAPPPSARGKRASPRNSPKVRSELQLQKVGTAVLPTAPRRPFPATSRPDTAFTFDWQGTFNGNDFVKIPHSDAFMSPSFSISFYITLHGNATTAWRNIVHKGFTNFQRTPSLWIEYGSTKLYAAISTSVSADETLLSKAALVPEVPTHVAYVVNGRSLKIFIDGELDSEKTLLGDPIMNTGPLYLGKDPFYAGATATIHSFKWLQRPLGDREVRVTSVEDRQPATLSFDKEGAFTGGSLSSITVPHQAALDSAEFSVCFWTTLGSYATGRARSLLHKGENPEERTPFIEVDEQLNRLNVRVSTTADANEGFFSKAVLRKGQPTHICYVRRDKELSLYVDGALDTQISTRGKTSFNPGPVFVGNSPFSNGYNGIITGWRWFSKGFTDKEVATVLAATATKPLRIRTSSVLRANDFIRLPNIPESMISPDFTVSFWIKPTQGFTGKWRSILHKGSSDVKRTPSIWFNPDSNRVTVEISTRLSLVKTVRLTSKRALPLNKVSHVAFTLKDNVLCILVEGWVDGCTKIQGKVVANEGSLMIGKSPRYPGFAGSISDIRYYPRALSRAEVSPYEMDIPEPVFSYWNAALGDHVLSLNKRIYGEGLHGYQIISAGETVGVHGTSTGTPIGYAHNIAGKYLVPLYSFFNERTGDHWYTTDASAVRAGYQANGPVMYVFPADHTQDSTVVPVYEHFNEKLGDSFFTPDPSPGHGYVTKGVAFFLHKEGTTAVPVFEYYNPPMDGGATLEVAATVPFNGWTMLSTSDLGFVSPSKDFAVAFWIKLRSSGGGFYRTILHHGSFPEERAPALYLMPHENRIAVRMSTDINFNEGMDSRTVLPLDQFTHVAMVSHGAALRLYINGKLDMHHVFTGKRAFNPGGFHVGRFPDAPGVDADINGFKFFDHIVSLEDVNAMVLGDLARPDISFTYAGELSKTASTPNSKVMETESFTLLFTYRLLQNRTSEERAIVWKGNNKEESAPSIVLLGDENRIMVRLSTTSSQGKPFFVISNAVLEVDTDYRVAVIRDGDSINLFINDVLDKSETTSGSVLYNNGPLYFNKAPWTGEHRCGIVGFRWFSRALSLRELRQFSDKVERRSIAKFDWRGRSSLNRHVTIPDTAGMDVTKDFTWSFWASFEYDTTAKWRQIALKGEQHFYKGPQISWFPKTGRIRVMAHLKDNVGEFEKMDSVNTVAPYTPTHVCLVRAGAHLRLFLNGIEEAQMVATDLINTPNDPLFLGNLNAHVSNFRWMDYALMDAEILQEVFSVSR